jgi:thiamine biosynthesis lipoprotein
MTPWLRPLLLLCAVLVALPIDGAGRQIERAELSDQIMGTSFTVTVSGPVRASLEAAARAALEEARRVDRLLSNYQPDSAWSAMNRDAARGPAAVPAELFDLIEASLAYSRASDGAFDITVGPLMRVWGFYKGEGSLPQPDEVTRVRDRVGYQHVALDARTHTVQFDRPGVEVDPGGIGKGYAVDRMVAVLKARGVRSAFVSAGGSSIYGLGAPPDDPRGWKATIRQPDRPSVSVADVFLRDMSLSTSGSYEKFFFANGRRYAHLMDPRTGYPAAGIASVSVLAPRTIDSEAWTKPFFINGRGWTATHSPAGLRVFMCEDATPVACAWVN